MAAGEVYQKILEHLKKDGPFNTFRLARNLNLDRSELLNFIEKLEEAGAVEVQHGRVKFLKFVAEKKGEEPKPTTVEKSTPKPKQKAVKKRKKAKKKPTAPKVQAENKELKEKILQLESKVEELEKKASASPKIIKKIIVKEVAPSVSAPTPLSPKKRSKKIKKEPKKKDEKKVKKKSKKFKFPKFTFMKNIKQLKKPEFAKKWGE